MDKVLYVAMTGARENMRGQQIHANNLANANTTGFKHDMEQARAMQVFGEGAPSRVYAMTENPATDFESGTLMETGRNLDVAIQGQGWLAVIGPDGTEGLTRAGELQIDVNGQLVTGNGLPVMGNGGIPIQIPPSGQLTIANDGSISVIPLGAAANEQILVDQLKLVNPDPQTLFKRPDGLMTDGRQAPYEPALNVQVRAGYLESSNVNAVEELTGIISLSRQFEMSIKMMKNAEENSTAATKILSLS